MQEINSPKRQWNLLIDEIKKGLDATQAGNPPGPSSGSASPTTASHSTPSFVMPPPVSDVTISRGEWGEGGNHRAGVEHVTVTLERPSCMSSVRETNFSAQNGDVSNNFLFPPRNVKVTTQCPLRKVEHPPRRQEPPIHVRSLHNLDCDDPPYFNTLYGACNHSGALADRRYYVRESLVTSPHTVRDVVTERRREHGKRRRRRRTASSRIRRKTQLHGRSAAYRIARRNAIRSRRRKNEIVSTKVGTVRVVWCWIINHAVNIVCFLNN